jgi:hypothetical protein
MSKAISCSNAEQWKGLSADIKGSIATVFDNLFNKSHVVRIQIRDNITYLIFDYVEEGVVRSETIRIPSNLFEVKE